MPKRLMLMMLVALGALATNAAARTISDHPAPPATVRYELAPDYAPVACVSGSGGWSCTGNQTHRAEIEADLHSRGGDVHWK